MSRRAALAPLLLLCACACAGVLRGGGGAEAPLDVKIVHGRVVDGTGAPWFAADVGIRGDTVVAIGDLSGRRARRVLEARGQVVAPGFIDLLGQSQWAVLEDPRLEGKVRQGVTTELTGEGTSPGPLTEEQFQALAAAPPAQGRVAPWRTLGEYLTRVEAGGSALNFALLVGHTNARTLVLGRGNVAPTPEQLRRMEEVVDQAMREGAFGLSTALIYVPAVYSTTEELVALARVAARHGGRYFTHLRSEGDFLDEALDEAFRVAREAGLPLDVWHLKVGGRHNWGRMPEVVARLVAAREGGLDVAASIYPYTASSTALSALLPNWALEGGWSALLERLRDPATRARIAEEIPQPGPHGFYHRLGGASGILVTAIPSPALEGYARLRLDEIARRMEVEPVEALLRLYEGSPRSPDAIYFSMSEEDMRHALRQPFVSVGADSGAVVGERVRQGAHPRAYGTFPRVLGRYCRDERLFSLEEAVRKLTSQAAARVGLWDRGVLRPGMKADVVVFDPAAIRDLSTYEDPHQFSQGVSHVLVNGVPVLEAGALTGALPGRVLRGPGWRR